MRVGKSGDGYADILRSRSWFSESCVDRDWRFEEMMLAWDWREGLFHVVSNYHDVVSGWLVAL